MTALDIFIRAKAAPGEIRMLEEKIERRRALQTSCTSKPLSGDAGGRSSDDASMRLLDYMSDIEDMEHALKARKRQSDADRACCVYLAEMMPDPYGGILTRIYLDGLTQRGCAESLHYSATHIRRMIPEAESFARRMTILLWDGEHAPVFFLPDSV